MLVWILRGLSVVLALLSAFGFVNAFYLRVHGPGADLGIVAGLLAMLLYFGAHTLRQDDGG